MAASLYADDDQLPPGITDNFKIIFKKLKRKKPAPDFSEVIDFRCINDKRVVKKHVLPAKTCHPDFLPVETWQVYEIQGFPDFAFIVNPFKDRKQYHWANRCLRDFSCKPNHRNLDAHMNLTEDDNLWKMYSSNDNKELMLRLRWATLGYHHNWSTKQYTEGNKSDIPDDLSSLASYVALALGYHDYRAEAAVVNYYNMDSTLGGHVDHSEIDHLAPLISFSFGQSAVFMLGGQTKEVVPVSFYIHSGDIVVMAGGSRLCYHGVPKIIKSPETIFQQCCDTRVSDVTHYACSKENVNTINRLSYDDCGVNCDNQACSEQGDKDSTGVKTDSSNVDPVIDYLRTHRVNMNVRQVLPPNQTVVSY